MATPNPRTKILLARGTYANLLASLADIAEGEVVFATDQNQAYIKYGGTFVATSVSSVNSQTGAVVLDAADVGAATAAQGALADTAVQPGDNISTLTNDAGYITAAQVPADAVSSVNGQTGAVALDADDISDAATTNKFATQAELNKLAGIAAGAEVNVNADWNAASGDALILNKPALGTAAAANTTDFATAAQGATADSALQPADIGTTVQGYDADTVVTDVAPTFTATVQTTERTITGGAFDLATGNHWTCGAITVPAPTNATAGTSGLIRITAGPVVWNAVFKFPGGTAPTIASFPAIIPFYVESGSVILMGNVAEGIA